MDRDQDKFIEHITNLYPHFTKEKQCWPGINPGWFGVLEEFYREMNSQYQASEDMVKWIEKFDVLDIKEKFGGLRVYYTAIQTDEQFNRAHEILCKSMTICENCGEPGEVRRDLSWHKTFCEKHYQERKDWEKNR